MEFYEHAYRFLDISGHSVSKSYIKEWMLSHPNYPALICFSDLLDEFSIDHTVVKLDWNQPHEMLPERLLIHVVSEKGETGFRIVKKRAKGTFNNNDLEGWTGITLLLEENSKIEHLEHNELLKNQRVSKTFRIIILSLLAVFLFVNQLVNFNWTILISSGILSLGFFISILIVVKEIGLKSTISDFFCKTDHSGCDKVLHSKYGKLGRFLKIGDLALIYFTSLILFLSFLPEINTDQKIAILTITLLPGLLITPVSVYYQIKLKSFCRLCSGLLLILWLQAINLFAYFMYLGLPNNLFDVSIQTTVGFFIAFLIAGLWIVVKPSIIQNQSIPHQNIMLRKWRQNPRWFDALLPLHKKIDDSIWSKEICYGNPKGVLQFLIVSNPFCDFCALAHKDLDKILDKHPEDIGIRIRFHLKTSDLKKGNKKHEAVLQILSAYEKRIWIKEGYQKDYGKGSREIITDWYVLGPTDWKKKYGFDMRQKEYSATISKLIHDSMTWCKSVDIKQTPSFFVNGHEMPNPHTFKDVFLFISDYIQILKDREQKKSVAI
ncbi:thioredoxin domain-containing protein [Muricauda sp. JGD-17]|uniref:Thioredoxin domain-containing protein n=1 Tax=Flagellimonas ochracea TaxID=2696472 RepID=A0A964TEZ7_9FLAO|nr:vitamin K epoxide reductase family protein [Allomuricauda ochracea]NAY93006.1 thioredoxin domain-containing protein [Allomuricauda ochracea]